MTPEFAVTYKSRTSMYACSTTVLGFVSVMWFPLLFLLAAVWITEAQSPCSRYPEFINPTTGKCSKDALNEPCLDAQINSCSFAVVNGGCNSATGICSCRNGFQEEKSFAGEHYCSLTTEGSHCTPGVDGNRNCRLALQDSEALCELHSCTCQCPQGKAFTGSRCDLRIFSSQNSVCETCERSGGVCFDSNGDTVPDGCHCPGKSFSSGLSPQDQLTFGCNGVEADIDEQCSRGLLRSSLSTQTQLPGVFCRDPNAECVHIGVLSGRHVCRCRPGYVSVQHSPSGFPDSPPSAVCHKLLNVDEDKDCEFCTKPGGQCYDINGDGVMDGCICPSTRSTTTDDLPSGYCNFKNVEVECNNSTMRVCLVRNDGLINIPPKINDVIKELDTGKAIAHIRGKGNDSHCHFEKQQEGVYCIDLRTDETVPGTFMEKCGALVVKPNKKQTSYMTWIVVMRNMTKMTTNDFCLHAYCTYDDVTCVSNGTLIKEPKHIPGTGKKLCPIIRLYLEDKFNELVDFTPISIGSMVRLVVEYVDDLGGTYTHLRPEICILSNLPHLDIPGVKTILFIDHGVLVENDYISLGANFKPDLRNGRVSRTGFFRMCMFEDSQYVFFHCAVRVCRSPEPCQPLTVKRKRRSVAHEGPITLPETLDDLEASGEYQRVEFNAKLPSERELALAEARERMSSPRLSAASLAVQVIKGDDYVEKTEAMDRSRIARENELLPSWSGKDNVKVKKVPEQTLHFSTVLAVICVGTAALTFSLALASFYLFSASRRPAKKEISSG